MNIKYIFYAVITISLGLASAACKGGGGESYDFRKTRWGMTQEEVKASEGLEPTAVRPGVITYEGERYGRDAIIGYVFDEGALIRAGYLIREEMSEPAESLAEYEKTKKAMIKEYGRPANDRLIWDEGVEQETDPADYGEAVCSGKLIMTTMWANDRTAINLKLDGVGGKCRQGVMYDSMDLYVIPSLVEEESGAAPATPGPEAE